MNPVLYPGISCFFYADFIVMQTNTPPKSITEKILYMAF
jgi:hypothetical protein